LRLKKYNKYFSVILLETLLVMVLFISGFSLTKSSNNYNITEMNIKQVPSIFNKETNIRASKEKLGFIFSETPAKIELHFAIKPTDGKLVPVTGNGVIHVGTFTFPFKISNTSMLYQYKLQNNDTIFWGPIIASIVNKKGENDSAALSIIFIPETGKSYINASIGTIDGGQAVISFGDNSFISREINNLLRENY